MQPEETSRWLETGQFWACLRPLYLMQINHVDEETACTAKRWTPEYDTEEMVFITPLSPETFRYLWHVSIQGRVDIDPEGKYNPQSGDIFIVTTRMPHWKDDAMRLIFIGPETDDASVQVCADWAFVTYQNGNDMVLYQPGPGRRSPEAKTVWERLRDPQSSSNASKTTEQKGGS